MKFGLFVPQRWHFDLVGIAPTDQCQAMNSVAQAADAGRWDSLWVYDHFHTTPVPSAEATHEAWALMAGADMTYAICYFPDAAYDPSGMDYSPIR